MDTVHWPAPYPLAHPPSCLDVDTVPGGAAAILRHEKKTQHTAHVGEKEKKQLGLYGIIEPLPVSDYLCLNFLSCTIQTTPPSTAFFLSHRDGLYFFTANELSCNSCDFSAKFQTRLSISST